jgi:hypothetical protein
MEIRLTNPGSDLLKVFDEIRDLFEQIGSLLSTADALMEKSKWKPFKGNLVTSDNSTALPYPRQWMPHYFCRPYANDQRGKVIGSVGVLIGMYEQDLPSRQLLSEPLICGSAFQGVTKEQWEYEFSMWHVYMPKRKDDGTVSTVDPRIIWKGESNNASKMSSFAFPLLEITDANDLKRRIVDPLLDLLSR